MVIWKKETFIILIEEISDLRVENTQEDLFNVKRDFLNYYKQRGYSEQSDDER